MLARYALHSDAESSADGTHGVVELRPFLEHRFAVEAANIVEVDVDGEARQIEDEQVQRRAALERDPVFKKRMAPECVHQLQKPNGLLQRVHLEPPGRSSVEQVRLGELHPASSQRRWSTYSGTTRFHRDRYLPGCRFPSR